MAVGAQVASEDVRFFPKASRLPRVRQLMTGDASPRILHSVIPKEPPREVVRATSPVAEDREGPRAPRSAAEQSNQLLALAFA